MFMESTQDGKDGTFSKGISLNINVYFYRWIIGNLYGLS